MNHIYFAKSTSGTIPRGSILESESTADNQSPVIVKEFEVFLHKGTSYLLADKEPIEFMGSLQTPEGNNLYFQKSNITYRYNQAIELIEVSPNWLSKGIQTNKGIVVEIGDEIAICKNGDGEKPYFKKSLLPIETEREAIDQELNTLEYRGRLFKSLTAAEPIKTGAPKFKVSFASQKAQIVPAQEHHEGETRQFSANDTRQLQRGKSGQLRWISVDEKVKLQQAKQKAEQDQSKTRERAKYEEGSNTGRRTGIISKLFRTGKEIIVGGVKGKVIDYGNDIIAVEKPDRTTVTIRASEYNPEKQSEHVTSERTSTAESPEELARNEKTNRKEQEQLSTDVHSSTSRNKYYDEQQSIIKEQKELPEYQKFQSEQEKDGWSKDIATPFRFVKDISFVSTMGNLRSGTAEKVWRPEKKDYDYYFEGQGFDVAYQGKDYNITGMNDKEIEIRDQFGNKQVIRNDELDQYKGQIILDADGNAKIKNVQGQEFSLDLIEGLSQEDLFKEGTVKIIRDEVWKSIKNGEGAVIDDIKLGKIRRGITFYKHGNEAGVIDENMHQHQASQSDTKRDIPDLDEKLKGIQKEVNKERAKLDKKNLERQDVETVKARVLHGNQNVPYADKGKGLDPEKYKDVFDKWTIDGGEGIDEQIAGSYANPDEWKANVLSLAERMRVEDVKRATEVNALNDFAKTGIIIEPKQPEPIEAYLDTAKDILMSRRRDFLRSKQTEKDESAKFNWDETAELPSAESGAIVSDNVKVIRDSRNDSYQVQYAFVPKSNVISSNNISGAKNEEHPSELQARERSQDEASNLQMRKIAADPNEELVEDNKDATRGAPVGFSKDGKVYIVQGNGRSGAVQGMEGAGKEKYFGMMLQKAKELGIPTDKINEDMMLVRTLSPVHTYEDARKLGAFGQKSSALPMTEVEEARSFQNAQRLKFGLNLNLTGIGRRSINEKNVGAFIRNNPQVYQKILKLSGYDPIAVQYRPAEQAKVVNTALLAQLDKDFIRTVSQKGEDAHELVKVTAPIIADNQKDIADGTVPPNGDIQSFLKNSIEQYDTLNSASKNLLKVDKNGSIPFLDTGDAGRGNPDSLLSRMRQEAIEFGDKKSGNIFRNPLNVIGLIAYHQAMTPRDPDKKDQARELFALKMKRFAEAMKTLKEKGQQGEDIFAAQLSPEQQTAQSQDDIVKIAEKVFLENKPYREENPEEMTNEEKEAGKQTYNAFDAYKKMKEVAKEFQFDLQHNKLKKSLLDYFFKSIVQKHHNEINKFKVAQGNLFGEQQPEHHVGDTKVENGETLTLLETTVGKPRWHTKAEIEAMKLKGKKQEEENPTIPQKSEEKKETSQVHGNMIEYTTQELFKQRGKKSADKVFKAVAEKFNGKENMFLGGKVSVTPEQLKDAVYKDKIATFKKQYESKPEKIEAGIEPFASYFNLDVDEFKKRLNPESKSHSIPLKTLKQETKPIRTKEYRDRQTYIDSKKKAIEIAKDHIESLTDAVENPAWEESRKEHPEDHENYVKQLAEAKKELAKQENELSKIEKIHAKETDIEDRQDPLFEAEQKKQEKMLNKEFSEELLSEFKDGKYSGVEFKALGIAKDIKQYKCSQIIGKKLDAKDNSEKLKQLAALSQIYRDPRFETFRAVYTKGNKIVGHTGVTLRLPGSTLIVPPNIKGEDLFKHYEIEMENLKADGMYFIHNHPSGMVNPSQDDINTTKEIAKNLGDKFKGHIVIDSNIYSSIDKFGNVESNLDALDETVKTQEDKLSKPAIPHPILGEKIGSPVDIASLMMKHKLDTKDGINKTVIALDSHYHVRAVVEVGGYLLLDEEKAKDILKRIAIQSGSANVFIAGIEDQYNKEEDFSSSNPVMMNLYREKYLADVVSVKGNSLFRTMFNQYPSNFAFGVKEESRQLVKTLFSFFKSQMDIFGASPKPQQPSGMNWKSLGQEKPNHKYKRRERGKSGDWVYYYEDAQGREFKGDAKGKELPKHHDWQKGDPVIHDGKKYSLGSFGDLMATIVSDKGEVKTARISDLTHESEHQKNLVQQHETKWDRLVSALEDDLKQFDETGKSKHFEGNTKLELQRKLKYAKEEQDKRKGNKESLSVKEPTAKYNAETNKIEIPDFKSTEEAMAFGEKASPEQIQQLRQLREETLTEVRKHVAARKPQEALNLATKAQFYREAFEAQGKKYNPLSIAFKGRENKSPNADTHGASSKEPVSDRSSEAGSTSKDQTSTPEFKKWFGSSKVVDKQGKPLKVFHGTFENFNSFDKNKIGTNLFTDVKGFFFSDSPEEASGYADPESFIGNNRSGGNIMPTYLSIKKPLEVTCEGDNEPAQFLDEHNYYFENAKKQKKDGLIVKNLDTNDRIFIVFSPSQIKSAIGNKGTFDPENADITKSIFSNAREWFKNLIQARKETDTHPTEKQKEVGNYSKGEINLYGLKISIENPKGSIRRGKDKDGKTWECKLKHDYGYINGTVGKDKDHLDVFIGTDKDAKNIYIVNQMDPETKKFDEHKILVLMRNKRTAIKAYKSNYTDDANKRIDSVAEVTIEEFKKWIENGNHKEKAE
jgi:hypothetical protein